MAKYKTSPSKETEQAAVKAAKATQKPGQSKQQTKLIAQGIQKGIEHYKKQQKAKARELDKKLKQVNKAASVEFQSSVDEHEQTTASQAKSPKLPWILLLISWALFAIYFILVA